MADETLAEGTTQAGVEAIGGRVVVSMTLNGLLAEMSMTPETASRFAQMIYAKALEARMQL